MLTQKLSHFIHERAFAAPLLFYRLFSHAENMDKPKLQKLI